MIEAIRNKEGGGHVSPDTLKKIAAVRRSRSGWQSSISENEDGSTTMYVGIDLTRQPPAKDSNLEEISDYELASVCAIAEEVLFSLTPEPENRKRMQFESYQGPFYMSAEETAAEKTRIRDFIYKLETIRGLDKWDMRTVKQSIQNLAELLDRESFNSEEMSGPENAAQLLTDLGVVLE